jgi:hypothetical protein
LLDWFVGLFGARRRVEKGGGKGFKFFKIFEFVNVSKVPSR